jgi:hypothetical protein
MADSLINKLPKAVNGKVPSWLRRALNPSTATTKNNETMRTTSFEYEGKEILVPTIRMIDGKLTKLSSRDAFEEALKKKDYLIFKSPSEATAMSKRLSGLVGKARGD